jgi:predicted  nucleic acid-binding Zn-ribbon protein
MLQQQIPAIEEVFDSIAFMKKNLESETARAFIAKMEEIKAAFNDALEDVNIALEALQGQANLLVDIEIETAEIEEEYFAG